MQPNYLDLLDYRRRVAELYKTVRDLARTEPRKAWLHWRDARDDLFATHPQTPLVTPYQPLSYFAYDPAFRFCVQVELGPDRVASSIGTSTGVVMPLFNFGRVTLPFGTLDLYWLDQYGGGVFMPFQDATNHGQTYGGGRYLLDTIKSADLGTTDRGELILDFNFAFNPSCHYDPQWSCPLTPPANRLSARVEAGEKCYHS